MPKKLDLTPEEMQERRRAQWRRYRDQWNIERNPMLYGPHMPPKERKALMDRQRNARPEAQARRRELQTGRYHSQKDDPEFRAKARENARKQHAKHPERTLANVRLYQTRKIQASPPWLTNDHKKEMLAFYRQARKLTLETGVPHHVDHIEPLRGKDACGLHVPWNLQVLTGDKNLSKGNRREATNGYRHPDTTRAVDALAH